MSIEIGAAPGLSVPASGAAAPGELARYGIEQREPDKEGTELGQDEFLKLMLTQLKHQDPFKPMENGEFIGQMAQFSTVSGIEKMQDSLDSLAGAYGSSQTLQASELVGRDVLIDADTVFVTEDEAEAPSLHGRFELDASAGDVTLDVRDANGATVRSVSLGQHGAGSHDFAWDGRDADGDRVPPGRYTVSVTIADGEERLALDTLVARTVDSVEFAPGGTARLNTGAGESLSLGDVRSISARRPG